MVLGTAFTSAGIAHVVKHEWFEQLVPEQFTRWRKPISSVTAVIQFVGGISMFIPRLRAVARWTNLAMLVPTLAAAAQIKQPRGATQSRCSTGTCPRASRRTDPGCRADLVGHRTPNQRPALAVAIAVQTIDPLFLVLLPLTANRIWPTKSATKPTSMAA